MQLLHVNVLAVLAAAVAQWVLGYIWYGLLFKKDFQKLAHKDGAAPSGTAGGMALIFIANLILAFALVRIVLLAGAGWTTWHNGSLVGVVCGLGFIVPPLFAQHIGENKPFKLFGIHSLYWLIGMYLSGGILAVWR